MATSTFIRVTTAGGVDITEHVTRFTFEDCLEEDDQLRLTIGNANLSLLSLPALQKGQTLLFTFGYLGGVAAKERSAKISAVNPDFGTSLTINIMCGDAGQRLKKAQAATLYQGKTSSDIAAEIAKKHGLTPQIDPTSYVWKSLPQAGKTDFELLKYLARYEQNGSYRFFIKGGVLHFNKVNLRKTPRRAFRWGDPDGNVVSFKPRDNDGRKKGASARTTVAGINPLTGAAFRSEVSHGTTPDDAKLGTYNVHYDQNGLETGRDRLLASARTTVPAANAAQAANVAASDKKRANGDDLTADLTILGDPLMEADELITMSNVGPVCSGNWFVKKVVHDLNPGSYYLTRFELSRNATNHPQGQEKATDKNNAAGPPKAGATRPLNYIYNQDANQVK
jgi:phage protein D